MTIRVSSRKSPFPSTDAPRSGIEELPLDQFDVVVVGCGPAGATAARVAAECGRAVLIIDRKRSVGQPPRCAGFVPSWLPDRAGVDPTSVIQPITQFRFSDATQSAEVNVEGCVIDRTRFDKTLAILALEAGADLCNGFVIRREARTLIARRNGAEASFSGGAIVCADGAASVVSRSVYPSRRRFLATMQFEVGLEKETETVCLRRTVFEQRGLGWFIPSGRTAKIGVALPRHMSRVLKPALLSVIREFERDGVIFKNAVLGATGGLVPIDRRPLSDVGLSMLVAGDARGGLGVDGAGIANAVLSGELAGLTAHRFLAQSSDDVIRQYDDELDQLLGCDSGEIRTATPDAFTKWVTRTQRFLAWSPDPINLEAAT